MSGSPEMTADEVVEVVGWLESGGVTYQVNGGWGVDGLVGRQTRRHQDLDLFVDAEHEDALVHWLSTRGYRVSEDWRPVRVELTGPRGRVDIHPMRVDACGDGVQEGLGGETYLHAAHDRVIGRIGGRPVVVARAERARELRQGYPPRDVDRHDLDQLDLMSDPRSWQTTTHDWATGVDTAHLSDVRASLGEGDGAGGRRHLVLEILGYANEEAEHLGRVGTATVTHHADGSLTVTDDGRGTDTRKDKEGRVIRKPVMATPDVRFKDESRAPLLSDGLPRRGMSVVSALSARLVHTNHRRSGSWSQTYRHGVPEGVLLEVEPRDGSGTSVTIVTDIAGPRDLTREDLTAFPWLRIEIRHEG